MDIQSLAINLAVAGLALIVGLGLGYKRWHRLTDPFGFRRWVSINRAEHAPQNGVLLFGDSIVERLHLTTLCGLPVFNVGLSSSLTRDHEPMLGRLLELTCPRWVIISTGANDVEKKTPIDEWTLVVRNILEMVGKRGILFGVPQSPEGDRYNLVLQREAEKVEATYIEPLSAELTTDGAHPSKEGYEEWVRRAEAACSGQP